MTFPRKSAVISLSGFSPGNPPRLWKRYKPTNLTVYSRTVGIPTSTNICFGLRIRCPPWTPPPSGSLSGLYRSTTPISRGVGRPRSFPSNIPITFSSLGLPFLSQESLLFLRSPSLSPHFLSFRAIMPPASIFYPRFLKTFWVFVPI